MKKIEKILVPLDFSECSLNGLDYAVQIAEKFSSEIILLHTTQVHDYELGVEVPENFFENEKKRVKEQMKQLINDKYAEVKDTIEFDLEVKENNVVNGVLDEAEDEKVDLIILGSKGDKTTVNKVFGSNASYIAQSAKCPVLVVPETNKVEMFKDVAFAYDYKEICTQKEFDMLCDMLNTFDANLKVLKVVVGKQEISPDEAEAVNNLDHYLHGKDVDFKYAHVFSDSVTNGLHSFTKNEKVDMMVVLPQKHNWIESLLKKSITDAMVEKSDVPVLVLHEKISS